MASVRRTLHRMLFVLLRSFAENVTVAMDRCDVSCLLALSLYFVRRFATLCLLLRVSASLRFSFSGGFSCLLKRQSELRFLTSEFLS